MLQVCAVTITQHRLTDDTPDPRAFAAQSALFFQRISAPEMARVLAKTPPGGVLRADDLFSGQDARWRLWRPVPLQNDPDALMAEPVQAHFLIKPNTDASYQSLVLVGIPDSDALRWPIVTGQLKASDPKTFFVLQPNDPASCVFGLSTIAHDLETLLNQV